MKILLSLALVAILMVSALAIPAFAAPDDGTEPEQQYTEGKKLEMVKNYLMPEGINVNNFKFEQEFYDKWIEKHPELDLGEYTTPLAEIEAMFNTAFGYPWIIDFVSFNGEPQTPDGYITPGTNNSIHGFGYGSDYYTEGKSLYNIAHRYYDYNRSTIDMGDGIKNDKVTINDLFRNESDPNPQNGRWAYPGQYVYTIREYTLEDNSHEYDVYMDFLKAQGYDVTMSKAKYKIYVNVAAQLDDQGKPVLNSDGYPYYYIDDIVIEVITPDNDSQKAGDKVDHVSFTNSIVQKPVDIDPEDPEDQKKTLKLEKKVTGKYGDYSKEFTFDFKIDKPDVEAAEDTVAKAAKLDKDGNKIGEEQFTYGQNKEVNLKAGESLVFTDVYFDSTWSFTEQGVTNGKTADGYTVTQAIKSGGTDADPADGEYIVKVDGENSHVITNDKSEIETPTGVLIDNLPYIIIFAAAAGGIVLFLAMKRRRRRNEE